MMLAAPEFVITERVELLDEVEVAAELQHRMLADGVMRGEEGSEFQAHHGLFSPALLFFWLSVGSTPNYGAGTVKAIARGHWAYAAWGHSRKRRIARGVSREAARTSRSLLYVLPLDSSTPCPRLLSWCIAPTSSAVSGAAWGQVNPGDDGMCRHAPNGVLIQKSYLPKPLPIRVSPARSAVVSS